MTTASGAVRTYDDNGNLTDRGNDEFGWDAENRLVSTSIGGTSTTYEYNGDGLRTARTIGASTMSYVWDVNRGIPQMLEDDGESRRSLRDGK